MEDGRYAYTSHVTPAGSLNLASGWTRVVSSCSGRSTPEGRSQESKAQDCEWSQ
jgi:hypothetical protein